MKSLLVYTSLLLVLAGCIKDDIVFDTIDPEVKFITTVDTLAEGDQFQFEAIFTNNIGQTEAASLVWESSDENILSVDQNGLITANSFGSATIKVNAEYEGQSFADEKLVVVGMNTVVTSTDRAGTIKTTSSYELQGDFTITKDGDDMIITFADNYIADSGLPGLYVYLTNNPTTIANALEIRKVDIFSGSHEYRVSGNIDTDTYSHLLYFCKPFNVKVGDGLIE